MGKNGIGLEGEEGEYLIGGEALRCQEMKGGEKRALLDLLGQKLA